MPNKAGTFALKSDIPSDYVKTTTSQTIYGGKTFADTPVLQSGAVEVNGQIISFPTTAGTLALKSEVPTQVNLSNYATLVGEETLTNKTLTEPNIDKIKQGEYTLSLPDTNATLATLFDVSNIHLEDYDFEFHLHVPK